MRQSSCHFVGFDRQCLSSRRRLYGRIQTHCPTHTARTRSTHVGIVELESIHTWSVLVHSCFVCRLLRGIHLNRVTTIPRIRIPPHTGFASAFRGIDQIVGPKRGKRIPVTMRGPRCGEVASDVGREHVSNTTTQVTHHELIRQMYLRPSKGGPRPSAPYGRWRVNGLQGNIRERHLCDLEEIGSMPPRLLERVRPSLFRALPL